MVQVLPPIETFASQFAKQLGSSTGEGIGNTPNTLMELLKGKRELQGQFGQSAVDLAKQYGRNLTPEDLLEIYKEGASVAKPNLSPSDTQQLLIGQAARRENKLSRMEENLDPDRSWKKGTDIFTGGSSEDRTSKEKKLEKQLGDSGMSRQQKRAFLSKKLSPEEVEHKINPLSPGDIESINSFPTFEHPKAKFGKKRPFEIPELKDHQREFFRKSLSDIFQSNPNINPLLLRREFEKKGVNWREFRDAVDELQEDGTINLEANEDNAALEKYLRKPPLGPLKELLHGLKLVGR